MVGEWIKLRKDLIDSPKVIRMAELLGLDVWGIVGRLADVWGWVDGHSVDGKALTVPRAWIDRRTECEGFADAMECVGWLEGNDGSLTFPEWDQHNSYTGKARSLEAEAKRLRREGRDHVAPPKPARPAASARPKQRPVRPAEAPPTMEPSNFDPWLQAFIETWNATPGCARFTRAVSHADRQLIDAARADPAFEANMHAALMKFPLPLFHAKGQPIGLSKFFEPGFVEKILDGKYDHAITDGAGQQAGGFARPSTRVDGSADAEALEARTVSAAEFLAADEGRF